MSRLTSNSDEAKRINQALQSWRQGDLALDEDWEFTSAMAPSPSPMRLRRPPRGGKRWRPSCMGSPS